MRKFFTLRPLLWWSVFPYLLLMFLVTSCGEDAPELAFISGVVRNGEELVSGASVTISDDDEISENTLTDESGFFLFTDLPLGTYNLMVEVDGFEPMEDNVTVDMPGAEGVNFNLTSLLSNISGRVFETETRTPIEDALAELIADGSVVFSAFSDEFGEFSFEDVDVGSYELLITKENYRDVTTQINLVSDQDIEDLAIELELAVIDPEEDPELLNQNLRISGSLVSGNLPSSTTTAGTPSITSSQSSASITNDNNLFIPFGFSSTQTVTGIFLQVNGAVGYWNIPITVDPASNLFVFPVGIPDNVLEGIFTLAYCVYDDSGLISLPVTLRVEVVGSEAVCTGTSSTIFEDGEDGLTIRTYDLGTGSGVVSITYEMFSAPDRMDVFYNNSWVAGTGSTLSFGDVPPASNCSTPSEGYVSGSDILSFNYDSNVSTRVDVVMSGCFGGTAWNYEIACP